MDCGNGSERTPHPAELLGDDWLEHMATGKSKQMKACGKSRRRKANNSLIFGLLEIGGKPGGPADQRLFVYGDMRIKSHVQQMETPPPAF